MAEVPDPVGDGTIEVDIPATLCGEIRDFALRLPEMTYHDVLGVHVAAGPDEIQRAFFDRSKTFHPDRYFHRELGPYEDLLHEIYKHVVAAHDVLRDEKLRSDYEKTLREKPTFRFLKRSRLLALPGRERKTPGEGRSLRDREGLRSKARILRDLEMRLESSRKKGREHYEEAQKERERGDWVRAASLVRLALAFDPREPDYHAALADVLPRANTEQAEGARARGELLLARGEQSEGLELLQEAFQLVPTDAELGHQIAAQLLALGERLDDAARLARQAAELDEMQPEYRKTLGMIFLKQGLRTEARRELQRAWELDPMDREVKKALSVL